MTPCAITWRPGTPATARLTLSFNLVGELVGELPPSARSRATWWANSPSARGQAQAWRDAGWRVQSVDLDAMMVVFTPDTVGTAPQARIPLRRALPRDPSGLA